MKLVNPDPDPGFYGHLGFQIQSVLRGRSVRKRREKLKAEGRTQSLPRDGSLPCKVNPEDCGRREQPLR